MKTSISKFKFQTDIMQKLFFSSMTFVTLTGASVTSFLVKPAAANEWCWCTKYVANKFSLSTDYVDAKDWNDSHSRYNGASYLKKNGFQQVSPRVGSIVVMESSFPGGNSTYGHVGVVDSLVTSNGKTYLNLRGANQGAAQFADAGCSNVNVIRFGTPIDGRSDISFWAKGGIPSVSMLVSEATGRTLDGGGDNGNSPYQHPQQMPSNPYQKWQLKDVGNNEYMIINEATKRALDGGGANSTLPYLHSQQMPWNPYQKWKLQQARSGYMIINVATGRALDSGGANYSVYMYPTPLAWNTYHVWMLK